MSTKVMSTIHSLKKFLEQYYSDLLLVSILFFFFLELVSDFIEAIYALCLLTLSLNENVLSILFFFSPLLLFFFKKRNSDKALVIVGELMVVCRILTPLVVQNTQIKMITSGIGVGCFLIFFPLFLQQKYMGDEELNGVNLGLGLAIGAAMSILFRTLGSTIDITTYSLFQVIGWILAAIMAIMILGMFVTEQKMDLEGSASQKESISSLKMIGFSFGIIGILMMIYYSFASPTVISRWTEGDYFFIILLLILMLTFFVIFMTFRRDLLVKLQPWMIWLANAVFILTLVLTIFFNQIQFPSSAGSYPITTPPTTLIHLILLIIMLIFFPILFVDFTLISRELYNCKPSIVKLAGSFTLASLFIVVMIFAHVFTTVYDYIDIVGPLFRDMFWFVYLIVGVSVGLPALFITKRNLVFRKPSLTLGSRITSIGIILITIGTVLAAFLTTPIPTTPETTNSITVMTYNIQQGYNEDGIKNLNGQLKLVKSINPDIIGLQECDTARIANGNMDVVRYFANNLKMYSYYGPKTVTGTFGIALLSKYPIQNPRTFFMYSKGEQTATIKAQIEAGTKSFNIFVTHLGNGGPIVQQEAIMDELNGKPNVVLIGDFNFRPNTEQYNLTTITLNDSWLLAGKTNTDFLDDLEYNISHRIDHIFVSSGISVSECNFIVSKESDHPAVWATIELD
ncbi:MAG: endonuclease/exonuclease/phosphatase family protein [Candidatus Heimdallarchaeota archaeon]|nr:MAG: endonuclease/exonuclease/phosphatase family protein [Candidatus Heimdallarchaeota archaeon]